MDEFNEQVLFEQANVKVTTQRLVIADEASYWLANFVSAAVHRRGPRAFAWMLGVTMLGFLVLLGGGAYLVLGTPGMSAETPSVWLSPTGTLEGDIMLLALLGGNVGLIGTVLTAAVDLVWRRYVVRVNTISNESKDLFESRDRALVQTIVGAMNNAAARRRLANSFGPWA